MGAIESVGDIKPPVSPPSVPNLKQKLGLVEDAIAASIAAVAIGTVAGIPVDVYLSQDLSYDFNVLSEDVLIPPVVLGTLFGAVAFTTSFIDNGLAVSTRKILSGATRKAGEAIGRYVKNSIDQTIANIKAIPSNISNAIKRKVDDSVKEVKAIPTKV